MLSGLTSVTVSIFDESGNTVDGPKSGGCVFGMLSGLPAGDYFMRVTGNGSETGEYIVNYFYGAQTNSDQQESASVYVFDGSSSRLPSGCDVRASSASSNGNLSRIYLQKGTYFNVDVFAMDDDVTLGDISLELEADIRTSTPNYEKVSIQGSLLWSDEHSAISLHPYSEIASRSWETGARAAIVVPWDGWYFVRVKSASGGSRFRMYLSNYGSVNASTFVEP